MLRGSRQQSVVATMAPNATPLEPLQINLLGNVLVTSSPDQAGSKHTQVCRLSQNAHPMSDRWPPMEAELSQKYQRLAQHNNKY